MKSAQLYRTEKPGVAVHFNLGGSGTLQRQIEQGAPVDVFISASPDEMDNLEAKGLLLPGTRRNLVAQPRGSHCPCRQHLALRAFRTSRSRR